MTMTEDTLLFVIQEKIISVAIMGSVIGPSASDE
jgi:hypothetical protein